MRFVKFAVILYLTDVRVIICCSRRYCFQLEHAMYVVRVKSVKETF